MPAFEVLTLFPEPVRLFVASGLLGKAIERGLVMVHVTDIRTFTTDRHRTVDDAPFGGGPGMVMKAEPVVAALEHVIAARGPMHRVLLTPSAPRYDQRVAERLRTLSRIALVCGRYEGVDERVRMHFVDEALSIGDFVLNGGELAALAIIESVARLCEGVLGNPASLERESFARDPSGSLLEYPQYTRPADFRGIAVPQVLLQGNHADVQAWRVTQARARTWALRPDLRQPAPLPLGVPIHVAAVVDDTATLAELRAWVNEGWIAGAWSLEGGQLRAITKAIRKKHGTAPMVVTLADARGESDDGAFRLRGPGELLDAWRAESPRALLLVLDADPHTAMDDAVAAVLPLDPELLSARVQVSPSAPLASGPAMREAPAPRTRNGAFARELIDWLRAPPVPRNWTSGHAGREDLEPKP